jgi:hypothetical protein
MHASERWPDGSCCASVGHAMHQQFCMCDVMSSIHAVAVAPPYASAHKESLTCHTTLSTLPAAATAAGAGGCRASVACPSAGAVPSRRWQWTLRGSARCSHATWHQHHCRLPWQHVQHR